MSEAANDSRPRPDRADGDVSVNPEPRYTLEAAPVCGTCEACGGGPGAKCPHGHYRCPRCVRCVTAQLERAEAAVLDLGHLLGDLAWEQATDETADLFERLRSDP